MSKNVAVRKRRRISKKDMSATLCQMEKIVDDKLANQKVFMPILLTVVTSIIAFLFVQNLGSDVQTVRMYMMVFCYVLLCFAILLLTLFGKSDYSAKVKKGRKPFQPHQLSTYCNLSDEDYLGRLTNYAGRKLTHEESLSAKCIKQKINEYVFKKSCLNVVLVIIMAGVIILGAICLIGIFIAPKLLLYSGGTV